jgi:broad specificity phosphatase PhoE
VSRVILVRHAQSVWNVEGRWQGHADPPLSEEGEEQARAAAGRIGEFGAVVTSDLARARRTAAILAPTPPADADPELREYDVGAWSGRTRVDIEVEWPGELARFDAGHLESPPDGERRGDFEVRIQRAMTRLARATAGADRVLVVTHGGVVRTLARLHGWPETRISHLCGYEAETDAGDKEGTLTLLRPLDLLNGVVTGQRPGGELAY